MANERDIPIVFLTQPFIWSENMTDEALSMIYAGFIGTDNQSPDVQWYTHDAMRVGLEAYNREMLDQCAAQNLNCMDLAQAVTKTADNFYDDFHFSEVGADNVSENVFNHLKRTTSLCDAS